MYLITPFLVYWECLSISSSPQRHACNLQAPHKRARPMRYVFAECVFDTQLYTLHRVSTAIRLRPKAFRVGEALSGSARAT